MSPSYDALIFSGKANGLKGKPIVPGQLSGLCGGGGYAISTEVLQKLFANFSTKTEFYETYMTLNSLTGYSDITTSLLLTAYANASLVQLEGVHPWAINDMEQYMASQEGRSVPVLTLHYASGKMQEKMDIVNKYLDGQGKQNSNATSNSEK